MATTRAAIAMTPKPMPTPKATLEPVDKPDECEAWLLATGWSVGNEDEELNEDPGEADAGAEVLDESDEDGDEEAAEEGEEEEPAEEDEGESDDGDGDEEDFAFGEVD